MMLGRKQSLKGEPVLADYGPEEALNESADIEWVNMVILYFLCSCIKCTDIVGAAFVPSRGVSWDWSQA